jgi:very-short-patch-repair endonuclease
MRLYQGQPAGTVDQLRGLRRNATDAELTLRRALHEAFPNRKWRFQAPVGPFCVDFLCFAERLVIEVDGGQHSEAADHDAARTRYLEQQGYRVIRFWNHEVMENIEGVIAQISLSLWEREGAGAAQPRGKGKGEQLSPTPRAATRLAPLPMGEGM